jgi:hypothetical protein
VLKIINIMKKKLHKNYLILSLAVLSILAVSFYAFFNLGNDANSDLGFQAVWAQEGEAIKFTWADNSDGDVSSYKLYHGKNSGQYGDSLKTEGSNNFLVLDVSSFSEDQHYFAVSALDEAGNESDKSTELIIDLSIYENRCDANNNGVAEEDENVCQSSDDCFIPQQLLENAGINDTCTSNEDCRLNICESGNCSVTGNTCSDNNNCFNNNSCVDDSCVYNCVAPETCGNGIVETDRGEICDSNGRLCETDSGYLGEKYCNNDCSDYLSTCVALESCGDDIINGNEECEGTNTDIACSDGIYSGTATCSNCQISDCDIGSQVCGNSIIEGGEQCDVNDFGNETNSCSDWGYYSAGIVVCDNSCQVDYSNCVN